MDKTELRVIEQGDEIYGFLNQSNISSKNLSRLQALAESDHPRIAEWAMIVLEIAKVKPHKRRRLKVLEQKRPDLLRALKRNGLIDAHHW